MRSFLKLFPSFKQYQLIFALLSLMIASSIVLQGFSIVKIVEGVFIQKIAFHTLLPYFGILLIAFAIRLFAGYLLQRIGNTFAMTAKNDIRQMLLSKWQMHATETMKQKQAGQKISLYVDIVDELDGYFREYLPQKMKSQIVPIVLLVCIVFAHPLSALILLITAPFIPLSYVIIGQQTKRKTEQQLDAMNRFSGKFLDLLHGLQTLKLFSKTMQQRNVLKHYNARFMDTTLSVLKIAFASTLFIELITTLGVGLVALEIGFQMIVFQTLTFAPAFFVLTLAPEFYNSLKELGVAFHTGKGSLAAMQMLEDELCKPSHNVQFGQEKVSGIPSLSLQQAVFQYGDGTTIGPITMNIPANKVIALIGPTGHGKTTILLMLSSMVELFSGSVIINDQKRQNVSEQSWYDEMIFINQHPFVFAGTVRDNLTMGKSFTDEQIVSSLDKAQLCNWLEKLPNGLDTLIGEGSLGVSGGEKQRIAIARALIRQPRIVFFDEPTAGLDVFTEQMITTAIKQLSKHATVVVVTHRYETLKFADYLYYIEHGKISTSGTHYMLHENPFYQSMRYGGDQNAGAF
ncbi:MAG: thiol reductant ABC exporter subunit CydD [Solibacillus sp.]|uniref:thiol reductant ABC exporter subunit CydD n=1 Tax=Solibacillus sp. TaxID=1909654 RepID=UPI003315F90A